MSGSSDQAHELCRLLDQIAAGARLSAAIRATIKDNESVLVEWRNEGRRHFDEHAGLAERMGRVFNQQRERGIKIGSAIQYVIDPALLIRFGFEDDPDSAVMAEMNGFHDYPYAHGIDGERIPLLSPKYPRPWRQGQPHPHSGKHGTFPKEANAAPSFARGPKIANAPEPPPPPRPSALGDYLLANAPRPSIDKSPPKPMTPLRAELMARAEALRQRGPENPRPRDRMGRPTFAATRGLHADDPPEKVGQQKRKTP